MTMEGGDDDDGKMIQTASLPPPPPPPAAAEGTETSDIGDHPHDDDDDYITKTTKTMKKKTAKREVRFNQSADCVRYIETKDEMPNREDYWLTPYDLYQMKNDFSKALRQQCPSVQKYQPHEVIMIQRKFKTLSRNILRQQEKNNRHLEQLQRKLQKHEEESIIKMNKKKKQQNNNIFGFLFNNKNNKNKDEKNDDDDDDDFQLVMTNDQKLKDELKTFRERDGPENIAQLYKDITKSDVDDAIKVASQLEQELSLSSSSLL